MLHELVHCVVGPHNAAFYALLDSVTAECEAAVAAGTGGTGAGFDARPAGRAGARLGAGLRAGEADPHKLRAAAAKARVKDGVLAIGTVGGRTCLTARPALHPPACTGRGRQGPAGGPHARRAPEGGRSSARL